MSKKNSVPWPAQLVIQCAVLLTGVLFVIKVFGLGYLKWIDVLYPLRSTLVLFMVLLIIHYSFDFYEKFIEHYKKARKDDDK